MSAWLKRFALHLAAAVGATGVFVTAVAVGAHQNRPQVAAVSPPITVVRTRAPTAERRPTLVPTPTPTSTPAAETATPVAPMSKPAPKAVPPERSLAGTIKAVQGEALDVLGVGGREWHVAPAPGALIRLNGKAAKLDALQPGQNVVILGQAEPGPGSRFLAHAITAKSK